MRSRIPQVLDNEWGLSAYPLVAGHEGVGPVTAVGAKPKAGSSANASALVRAQAAASHVRNA